MGIDLGVLLAEGAFVVTGLWVGIGAVGSDGRSVNRLTPRVPRWVPGLLTMGGGHEDGRANAGCFPSPMAGHLRFGSLVEVAGCP